MQMSLASKVIFLLVGVIFASVEEDELAVCKRQLMDQSYLSQACSSVSSYLWKDTQIKSTLRRAMHHLDLLTHDSPTEGVEKQLVLNLSQEDLRKLREFVNSDKGTVTDVESILIRSLEVKKPWLELPNFTPGLRPSSDHLNAGFVILFQVLHLFFILLHIYMIFCSFRVLFFSAASCYP